MSINNSFQLSGNTTKDPEIRVSASGTKIARVSIAVRGRNKEAQFFNCTAFVWQEKGQNVQIVL